MMRWLQAFEARHGLDNLTAQARRLVLGSYSLLLLATLGWSTMLYREASSITPVLAFMLPPLLFLPSIITKKPRGHAWLSFVSLLYFMIGVNVAILPRIGWLGLLIALASLGLFLGSMFYARFRSRQQQQK